jgi:hypothetical protein
MLSITCDNASNNDAMVRELSMMIPTFGGTASHTRCFLHTVNLVAKSLIREFDVNKKEGEEALADDAELIELSEEIDGDASADCDDDEGWVDEVELLEDDERDALEKDIRPVKLALVKVSQAKPHTFTLK